MFKITEAHRAPHLPPGIPSVSGTMSTSSSINTGSYTRTVRHLIARESNLALLAHDIFNHSLTVRLIHIKNGFWGIWHETPYEPGQIVYCPGNAGCYKSQKHSSIASALGLYRSQSLGPGMKGISMA